MEAQRSQDDHDAGLRFKFVQHNVDIDIDSDAKDFDYNFNPSFGELTNLIRKSSRSLRNRLRSIKKDSEFVERVAEAYQLPVVTNARAGDWYIDPKRRDGSVYFKSTDGHTGQWKFSSRRLNLGLLGIVEKGYGAIIVDSTRRGKRFVVMFTVVSAAKEHVIRFPDSIAKTIPIWISVLNKVCFPERECVFYTNPLAVSPSEASQIEQRMDGFVEQFLLLGLDIGTIKLLLQKPLRPIWVTPDSSLPSFPPEFVDFMPLVLVTASRVVKGEGVESEYIQGAGDDHEGWATESGLTPAIFWENHELLLKASEDELLGLARSLARPSDISDGSAGVTLVSPTKTIYVGSLASARTNGNDYEVIVNCSTRPFEGGGSFRVIDFPIPDGKKGAGVLRTDLQKIVGLLDKDVGKNMFFACLSGNEIAPTVALVVLCLYYDNEGKYRKLEDRLEVNKQYIRRRLAWISSSRPEANPSRSSLNAVNSFLMGRPV